MASKRKVAKRASARSRGGRGRKRGSRFADSPSFERMKRKSPDSAPRLFEWLVDQGYIEPVPTYRRKSANRQARRR
jgi:hypothetical protein